MQIGDTSKRQWNGFINERETPSQSYSQEEQQMLLNSLFRRKSPQRNGIFHNPYIDSLVLTDAMGLFTDPHYQTFLSLGTGLRKTTHGILSYKKGVSDFHNGRFLIENAYVFFETPIRIYVFRVPALNHHLSANVLVFEKKPSSQNRFLADSLYRQYFQGLRGYFDTTAVAVDEDMITFLLDHLTINTTAERLSNFVDRLIHRLMDVQSHFRRPSRSTTLDIIIKRYKSNEGPFNFQNLNTS